MVKHVKLATTLGLAIAFAGMTGLQTAHAQIDPGVQAAMRGTGAPGPSGGAGQVIIGAPGGDPNGFTPFWDDGLKRFQQVFSVSGGPPGYNGLGPRFNSNSCFSCHSQPAIGGSAAAVNPQASFTTDGVAPAPWNVTPSFITASGPTREARFVFFLTGSGAPNPSAPNGGVEDLFTVSGRPDAGSCVIPQPNFPSAVADNNVIFRIPTPTFGLGLVENLDESTLLINQAANLSNSFGISGTFNHNGNDGTISRFGWKAQNKSNQIFSGEATNAEMGITNLLFPNEHPLPDEDMFPNTGLPPTCLNLTGTGYPEDKLTPTAGGPALLDDVTEFANFMRFNAPPVPGGVILSGSPVPASSIAAGSSVFSSIGCATCHNPSAGTTQASNLAPQLSGVPVNAYSDFEIHDMGTVLADNVAQGTAGGNQFRTAPLWGLGQRIFLMHDGRETNLNAAINDHASSGSEATQTVINFSGLSPTQQQNLLNFLRSL